MRRLTLYVLSFLLFGAPHAAAQDPTNDDQSASTTQPPFPIDASPLNVGTAEWMITAGLGRSVELFHSTPGYRYTLQTLSWGQILTASHGFGWLRGRFEWAVELLPVYGQYAPTRTYGVGVSPLVWRWNFEPRGKLAPYGEVAGGALFTRSPVPAGTTTTNFTGHVGLGVRLFFREHEALILGYRFHHISNGNRIVDNPALNAHVLQFGWSHLRPRR